MLIPILPPTCPSYLLPAPPTSSSLPLLSPPPCPSYLLLPARPLLPVHQVRVCPKRRQTLLFSATMSGEVQQLASLSLNLPVRLSADASMQRPRTLEEETKLLCSSPCHAFVMHPHPTPSSPTPSSPTPSSPSPDQSGSGAIVSRGRQRGHAARCVLWLLKTKPMLPTHSSPCSKSTQKSPRLKSRLLSRLKSLLKTKSMLPTHSSPCHPPILPHSLFPLSLLLLSLLPLFLLPHSLLPPLFQSDSGSEGGTEGGSEGRGAGDSRRGEKRSKAQGGGGVIVFSGRKVEAHRLKIIFGLLGWRAAELHGNLTQAMRLDALERFRTHDVDFLIATDVAARGLDIAGVQTVVNYHTPREITNYVHRVGRTARAGKIGSSVTFVGEKDRRLLKAMTRRAGRKLKQRQIAQAAVERWRQRVEGMERDVAAVMKQETEERVLRKAEMEAVKAENMLTHRDEIFAKPKRTWFQSKREKEAVAEAAKAVADAEEEGGEGASGKGGGKGGGKVLSLEEVQEKRRKEKMKKQREKSLPRKKRRKLEAERQAQEEEAEAQEFGLDDEKPKAGKTRADLAYRKAKAIKSAERLRAAGKIVSLPKAGGRAAGKKPKQKTQSRSREMKDLFQTDMAKGKGGGAGGAGGEVRGKGKAGGTFKSKKR
ncbi:unnamed protein product [Closterium sp. Naga37s-1]|nr:unnamed protein product [Closterium sp. Naga37s-1]